MSCCLKQITEAVSEISHLAIQLGVYYKADDTLGLCEADMEYDELIKTALEGLPLSYAPYSGFNVSAALLTRSGRIYHGVNIENAAFTPTVCAERTAFFKAVSEGIRGFEAICIAGCHHDRLSSREYLDDKSTGEWAAPCGVCRQVMREFCDPREFKIVLARSPKDIKIFSLEELLPESFGPEDLNK